MWSYTPRRMAAYARLAHKRRQRELRDEMVMARNAQADVKSFKQIMQTLDREM